MTRHLAALLIVATLPFATAVANRCKGEASFAVGPCACTVRNRIEAGWNPAKVLSHYYAPDVSATSAEVAEVRSILAGKASCEPALYFMYSRADVAYLGIGHHAPALVVQAGGREVRFYGRWFRDQENGTQAVQRSN